ncbi:hypothetical protein GCM10014715_51840 [Streptomyces spiralis]|uniref:Uncharacterized protein n=1 Tax=Streptomyces spiralis TaxID=66376 RepID=A0A919DXU0_9ACTN|nr:hypothetical protein GCM10014715_51840 [Streptomyces spiralis]
MDPSPAGNDPATPVVSKGTEGTLRTRPADGARGSPTPYAGAETGAVVLGDDRIRSRTVR